MSKNWILLLKYYVSVFENKRHINTSDFVMTILHQYYMYIFNQTKNEKESPVYITFYSISSRHVYCVTKHTISSTTRIFWVHWTFHWVRMNKGFLPFEVYRSKFWYLSYIKFSQYKVDNIYHAVLVSLKSVAHSQYKQGF